MRVLGAKEDYSLTKGRAEDRQQGQNERASLKKKKKREKEKKAGRKGNHTRAIITLVYDVLFVGYLFYYS